MTTDNNALIAYNADDDFAEVTSRDRITPRLVLQQFLSPLVTTGKAAAGAFVSNEDTIIPMGKTELILPLLMWKSWIQWNLDRDAPKEQRIVARSLDRDGELAKTAEQFVTVKNKQGKDVPLVTEYYNFIIGMPKKYGMYEPTHSMSFFRSSHRVGKLWINRMMSLRRPDGTKHPMFAHMWEMGATVEKKDGNSYTIPHIGAAQPVDVERHADLVALVGELRAHKDKMAQRAMDEEQHEAPIQEAKPEM